MKNILYRLLATLFVIVIMLHIAMASEPQVFIRGIRPLGMGGAFVALSDDQNAVFYNPSGLTQRQGGMFTLFELPINISQDVLNFYDFYNDNSDKLKNFSNLSTQDQISLLNQINDKITSYMPEVRTGFPNTSFISSPGFITWGAGLYDQADVRFQFNRSLIVPSLNLFGDVDAIAAVPIAHRFDTLPYVPGSLSVGVTLKAIYRGQINVNDESVLAFDNFSPQVQMGKGFGMDFGTLYQPNTRWNFGLQVTDVGGTNISYQSFTASQAGQTSQPAYTSMIDPQWNIGTAYIPSKIYYWPGKYINTEDRLILAADVRDFLNPASPLFDPTFWVKLHFGAEFRWGPISLRGGYSSGYPSFGFGMRVPYLGVRVDYAYWGDELGMYAGQDPQWNQQVTIAMSWGDQKGRPYGNDTVKRSAHTPAAEQPKQAVSQPAIPKPAQAVAPSSTPGTGVYINASESTTTTGVQSTNSNIKVAIPSAATAAPAATAMPVVTPSQSGTQNVFSCSACGQHAECTEEDHFGR